jgi:hypothetical protein
MRPTGKAEYQMKRLALVVTGIAVAGLSACTSSAPSAPASSPGASSSPAATIAAAPAMCRQQYDAWKQGAGKGLVAAINAVGSAGQTGDIQVLRAVLKSTKPELTRATRHPMPTCADPKGYWPVLLMHVNAAAASTRSAATLTAAMRGVPTLAHELNAELKRTEG